MTDQEFGHLWRNQVQFLPPCDKLSGKELEPFKQFAREVLEFAEADDEDRPTPFDIKQRIEKMRIDQRVGDQGTLFKVP